MIEVDGEDLYARSNWDTEDEELECPHTATGSEVVVREPERTERLDCDYRSEPTLEQGTAQITTIDEELPAPSWTFKLLMGTQLVLMLFLACTIICEDQDNFVRLEFAPWAREFVMFLIAKRRNVVHGRTSQGVAISLDNRGHIGPQTGGDSGIPGSESIKSRVSGIRTPLLNTEGVGCAPALDVIESRFPHSTANTKFDFEQSKAQKRGVRTGVPCRTSLAFIQTRSFDFEEIAKSDAEKRRGQKKNGANVDWPFHDWFVKFQVRGVRRLGRTPKGVVAIRSFERTRNAQADPGAAVDHGIVKVPWFPELGVRHDNTGVTVWTPTQRKQQGTGGRNKVVASTAAALGLRAPQPSHTLRLLDRIRELLQLLAAPLVNLAAPVGEEGCVGFTLSVRGSSRQVRVQTKMKALCTLDTIMLHQPGFLPKSSASSSTVRQ
ncbi:hypothetical protein K438DRAFT_1790585 [Mycena galopus ATCC 62051]|nr:hypothetical protein K438DRAFT_1790585 [Mycena galopus ATCC 62051]